MLGTLFDFDVGTACASLFLNTGVFFGTPDRQCGIGTSLMDIRSDSMSAFDGSLACHGMVLVAERLLLRTVSL